ncbi:dihydropteroate synthase [Pseudoduganella umbonata]|uniref:Dihydropteroate synthase n=2 Tax=Pseudoduganella umbonata TaxID=864828 RepID=A0A7W5HCL1_9BURK|nr:dihydropteroate synthase [Pseudoduganella umbonata]MBB3221769.1 dihydropteroate synthase [Pseudoduganella umbonata]
MSRIPFGRHLLAANRALVMGILNVTPDSFSDGGKFAALDYALSHAEQMIRDGADIIDVGGESTRPGAPLVPAEEELRRVLPVLYALRECGTPVSLDTYKPALMKEAVLAGVDMINDINAFRAPGAIEAVRDSDCALCIMHMLDKPATMQDKPAYDDVVLEVTAFLRERIDTLAAAGIDRRRLWIDPGFGFGKTVEHNYALLKAGRRMVDELGVPLLAGVSRKSMIGAVTGKPVEGRLAGSIGGALAAVANGARIVRVHDVGETVDALKVWHAATGN